MAKVKFGSSSDRSLPDLKPTYATSQQVGLPCKRSMNLFITDAAKHILSLHHHFPGYPGSDRHGISTDSQLMLNAGQGLSLTDPLIKLNSTRIAAEHLEHRLKLNKVSRPSNAPQNVKCKCQDVNAKTSPTTRDCGPASSSSPYQHLRTLAKRQTSQEESKAKACSRSVHLYLLHRHEEKSAAPQPPPPSAVRFHRVK